MRSVPGLMSSAPVGGGRLAALATDRSLTAVRAFLLSALAAGPAVAHDFWILPSSFSPAAGSRVAFHLRVGDRPPGSPVVRDPERIVRFSALGPDGEAVPVDGVSGTDPAGFLEVGAPGVWAVGLRSNDTAIELPAEQFEAYLAEKGLDHVLRLRGERGEADRPGKELYSRSVKALLLVGEAQPDRLDEIARPLGLDFELVPEADPFRSGPEDPVPFRVLFDGQPEEGVLVEGRCLDRPARVTRSVSDASGRAHMVLDRAGTWLITAVTMHPAPDDSAADWQSIWTSLTFDRLARHP